MHAFIACNILVFSCTVWRLPEEDKKSLSTFLGVFKEPVMGPPLSDVLDRLGVLLMLLLLLISGIF